MDIIQAYTTFLLGSGKTDPDLDRIRIRNTDVCPTLIYFYELQELYIDAGTRLSNLNALSQTKPKRNNMFLNGDRIGIYTIQFMCSIVKKSNLRYFYLFRV